MPLGSTGHFIRQKGLLPITRVVCHALGDSFAQQYFSGICQLSPSFAAEKMIDLKLEDTVDLPLDMQQKDMFSQDFFQIINLAETLVLKGYGDSFLFHQIKITAANTAVGCLGLFIHRGYSLLCFVIFILNVCKTSHCRVPHVPGSSFIPPQT